MFSNGVIALAVVASLLIVAFNGVTTALIPLYAVGVFTDFTLSQFGMVRFHRRNQVPGWRRRAIINLIGSITTGVVLAMVVVSKFTIGAWIPVVLIPLIVLALRWVKHHYSVVKEAVAIPEGWRPRRYEHFVVVLVGTVNKGVLNAITYARSLAPDRIIAVSVVGTPEEQEELTQAWDQYDIAVELRTIYSPYRELTHPVLEYLDELDEESDNDIITVVIPEFVTSVGTSGCTTRRALQLKLALLYRPHTVVTSVPIHVDVETGNRLRESSS